ncbi:hypothetical protein [Streptomyces griseoaurantiacus]|uniref:hypothetical protein n=1 Tax=Streptomyces griseoaurantiacus TaxID=68213 RepID=UPI001991B99D|nr:hypothetical protein GCM10018782_28290 [Streptomyces griseoaurantiacus]
MPARTHTPPRSPASSSASSVASARVASAPVAASVSGGGVDIRLPWWALALPVAAFLALLALILNPAHTGAAGADTGLARVVEHAVQLIDHP